MPCSCKNKKKALVIIPSRRPLNTQILIQRAVKPTVIPKSFLTNKDIVLIVQYDFTPTVTPLLLCIQCTIKHLSFALVLMLSDNTYDKLAAIGQLMCARYHTRKFTKALSIYFAVLIMRYLMDIDILKELNQLIQVLKEKGILADLKAVVDKSMSFDLYTNYIVLHNTIEVLLYMTYAYALMFSLPLYLDINRTYAVGALTKAAYIVNNKVPLMKHYVLPIRRLWKKILTLEEDTKLHNNIALLMLNLIDQIYVRNIKGRLLLYKSRDWSKYRRNNVKPS